MERPRHVAPASARWVFLVRALSFLLGAAVILDALVTHAAVVQWVAGLILVGIVPPEAVAGAWRRPRR